MHSFHSARQPAGRQSQTTPARRRVRVAVEAIEERILLSTYTVNTFVDQTDPAGSHTVSLRDAIADVVARGGTINLPAGVYPLTHGQLLLDSPPAPVTINSVGGVAVIDAGGKSRVLQVAGADAAINGFAINGVTLTHGVADDGGAIENQGMLTLTNCTISDSTASNGGGGGIDNIGSLTLIGCTVSGNSSGVGGGIESNSAPLMLTDCTIAGNSAIDAGGIHAEIFTIQDCTVSNNSALDSAGGLKNNSFGNGSNVLSNNIIAGNHAAIAPDIDSVISPGLDNLIGFNGPAAVIDARLAPLGNYGGPTQTMVPLAGSPALGMGDPHALPSGLTVDQRNMPRVVNGRTDLGAVQTQPPKIHVTAPAAQSFAVGSTDAVKLGSFTAPAGSGPFTVGIDWNDGSDLTFLTYAAPGSLGTRSHTFARGGSLTPTVAITDRFGDLSNLGALSVAIHLAPLRSLVVNTPLDQTHAPGSSLVSLRDAVNHANQNLGPASISFDPRVFASHQTITLDAAPLELSNVFGLVSIVGPSNGVTISGANGSRVMQIDTGVIANLKNIALTEGNNSGLYNAGTVTLTTVTVANNTGGPGAGIENQGTLTINYSLIDSNSAPGGDGGGIDNGGDLTLNYSTISGNTDTGGNGAGLNNTGIAAILGCTFSQNQTVTYSNYQTGNDYGGAINNSGTLTLTNSTLSGNSAGAGGGIENSGTARIVASTITENDASGGGIDNAYGASLTLADSIVATNTSSAYHSDVSGAILSLGHNLIGDVLDRNEVSTNWLASDLKGTDAHPLDPRLSPLDSNGGVTQTQIPLAGSPAIGAGAASLLPAGTTRDQRGFARVAKGIVDIGAVELQRAATFTVTPPARQNAVVQIAKTISLGSFATAIGRAPFHVIVDWGDGSAASHFTIQKAGSPGSLSHTFIKTGTLTGTILVRDNQGDITQLALSTVVAAQPAFTIVVNSTKDQTDPAGSKTVTLRDAISVADRSYGPVNIRFDSTVFASAKTIAVTDGLSLSHNVFGLVTLSAPGSGVTIDGGGLSIGTGDSVSLSHINVAHAGQTGIVNNGTATLADCNISNNQGIYGGGIYNAGTMTITRCTIDDNQCVAVPGNRGGYDGGFGGGIDNEYEATMTITDSTISGNTAGNPEVYPNSTGDAISNDGTMALHHTSVPGDPGVEILNNGHLTQS